MKHFHPESAHFLNSLESDPEYLKGIFELDIRQKIYDLLVATSTSKQRYKSFDNYLQELYKTCDLELDSEFLNPLEDALDTLQGQYIAHRIRLALEIEEYHERETIDEDWTPIENTLQESKSNSF